MEPWDWTPYLAMAEESPEAVHRRWHAAGLVDGLPIVPPTAARVRRLFRDAGLDPITALAVIEPSLRPVTLYDAAVCATAAGCAPPQLPIVAAAVRAVAEPPFNLLGIQTTTGTATPVVIAHGPAAHRAGLSGAADCLGGSTVANATIGRALRLLLRAMGDAGPEGMDRATMGQPAKLGLCFTENDTASPWPPLHTTRGFSAEESAVTVVGISGSVEIVHAEGDDPGEILTTLAGSLCIPGNVGSHGLVGGGSPLLILSPEHATALDRYGVDRAGAQHALWQRAVLPLTSLAPSLAGRAMRSDRDRFLRIADRPDDILIAVAGGIGVKSTYLPSWAGGTKAVTVRV